MNKILDHIEITVKTAYIAEQTIENEQYLFTYTITITNLRDTAVQLLSRQWVINDSDGSVNNVEGEGVIGEKPTIAPQQRFTYTSGCVLKTPVGTMQGFYFFVTDSGEQGKAAIPIFTLSIPNILH